MGVEAITAEHTKREWGRRLRAARLGAARSQVDVANAAGLDQKTVSNAERGVGSLESYLGIAAELGVDLMGTDQ